MKKTLVYSAKEMKAPDSHGQFTAYIAQTWPEDTPKSNADSDGDIFLVGAFDEQGTETIPVFYQHDYAPTSEVGDATLLPQDSRSELPVRGQLKVAQGWPIADAVYESMLLPADDPAALREFSVGYEFDTKDITKRPDGVRVIRKSRVFEVSVVYRGAQQTQLLSVKHQNAPGYIQKAHDALVSAGAFCAGKSQESETVTMTSTSAESVSIVEEIKAAVDETAWDGNAAMQSCNGKSDFAKIAFERANDSDPDTAAHWALPHHKSPAFGPNVTGVAAAKGALAGARGGRPDLKDPSAAEAHLNAHTTEIENALGKSATGDWVSRMREQLLVRAIGA